MKISTCLWILAVCALAHPSFAQTKVITLAPGEAALILDSGASDYTRKPKSPYATGNDYPTNADPNGGRKIGCTYAEMLDVIRALEILDKYAPKAAEDSGVVFATGSGTVTASIGWYLPSPKSRGDKLREQAQELKKSIKPKLDEADRLDAEDKQVQWARDVLELWRKKRDSVNVYEP